MLKKYAIKVQETISDRATGNSVTVDSYFDKFENDRLNTRPRIVKTSTFNSIEEAESVIEELPVRHCGTYNTKYEYSVEEVNYTHANCSGWSDMSPYEIVRVISEKTIEIRAMVAKKIQILSLNLFLVDLRVTANQNEQKWTYTSRRKRCYQSTFTQGRILSLAIWSSHFR